MPDNVTIVINAVTMEGLPAQDPQITVLLLQTSEPQHTVAKWSFAFNSTATLTFPIPEDTFPIWQVSVGFSRFDAGKDGNQFFMPRGQANVTMNLGVIRLTTKWSPRFQALANLSAPRFDPFRDVLTQSNLVDLLDGTGLGDLHLTFDTLANQPEILAKTALLNLFSVLIEEHDPVSQIEADGPGQAASWFSYVHKIVRIGQERFIAEVSPTLFENISTLLNSPGLVFQGKQYFTEPDGGRSLHTGNIPPQYGATNNLVDMQTVKIPYEQGNVQLTVAFLRVNGVAVHLLDCDMDEHLNLINHGFDVVKHLFNGGTSPIAMHEYIVRDSAQNSPGGIATIDLGYVLV
jgi:hypothetical protein